MPARIRDTGSVLPRVRLADKPLRRIDPATVARALGAQSFPEPAPRRGPPHALLAVSQNLAALLRSSGGRPGLAGHTRRQKIPLTDSGWATLQELARTLQATGVHASAGQVAGVLLEQVLDEVSKAVRQLSRRLTVSKA